MLHLKAQCDCSTAGFMFDLCLIFLAFIAAVLQHPYHSLDRLHPLPPALMPALGKECEKMKQMKKRRRCNECRLIARFPLDDTTSINALDAMLRARVQIQISQRTQVSSTPIFTQTKYLIAVIMSWESNSSIMKALGTSNNSSSTNSVGSSSNPAGSSYGTGSSGFNNAWKAFYLSS